MVFYDQVEYNETTPLSYWKDLVELGRDLDLSNENPNHEVIPKRSPEHFKFGQDSGSPEETKPIKT
eukprot:CAMPEP_0170509716 /NCGR_PEP_ID=MMETSP0208-20121228/65364_1 /TAXON_ID=197538 /ORGANISM="Strombidium inclinatum, Strain S3" /LENGTH=65 /DNA_ID=CAMNT_0010793101 /DNA_START=1895 /DNA_END=2092 /DNA_ORIENTATION=+